MNPGEINLQQLLEQAQAVQQQFASAQQELHDAQIQGSAGGGVVSAVVNGEGELLELKIDPSVVDASDAQETVDTIADLVIAAVRDATRAADELKAEKFGPLTQGMGGGFGQLPGF
ncbi:YbaB/EbfC family nucleoid-associated protein [Nonomuraea sp. NBC_01738]|uniref:YbaB/EbfC family nucleoid-associated protein n=1 Tax=Nonomuraea sp. NBC_01738 TaxID=2976003 RepID=UPI002E0E84D9|nr:YbaB/EbfC family nucleoid-associated protein [Nonomuraea sp. NBC_01738]